MTDNEILTHYGTVSNIQARKKAELEYKRYKEMTKNEVSTVEKHFISSIEKTEDQIKKIEN